MKKILSISLLTILLSSCSSSYKVEEVYIDGKKQKVIIADNYFAKVKGIRPFEQNLKNEYDGMLFEVDKNTAFTTKNVKNYLLICSLKKVEVGFKTIKCKCVEPDTDKYYANSRYVYEQLFKDKHCKEKIKL